MGKEFTSIAEREVLKNLNQMIDDFEELARERYFGMVLTIELPEQDPRTWAKEPCFYSDVTGFSHSLQWGWKWVQGKERKYRQGALLYMRTQYYESKKRSTSILDVRHANTLTKYHAIKALPALVDALEAQIAKKETYAEEAEKILASVLDTLEDRINNQ